MTLTIKPGINVTVPLPPISYAIDSIYGAVNEGVTMPFTVTTAAVPDGTTLYWTIANTTTGNADFSATSGTTVWGNDILTFIWYT
jgi:hypothetical protein